MSLTVFNVCFKFQLAPLPDGSETKASKGISDRIFADWIVSTFKLRSMETFAVNTAGTGGWCSPRHPAH
jgi:hypothetical protein